MSTLAASAQIPPSPSGIPSQIYSADREQFARDFNERPFMVDHSLGGHPAVSMDRLHNLLERSLPIPNKVYWNAGKREVGQKWSDRPGRDFSIEEAFRRIRESDAWIIIFGAERDPEIHAMLEEGLKEVQELTGIDFAREVKNMQSIVFITSPHRISEYHIDRECSMLLQVHGKKTIHIFDQNDREVLPEEEKERFWSVDNNAAVYKPQFQDRAHSFLLEPGKAVHIPVNAPHWLQNGDDISVSINQNFQFKNEKYANIYRANYYLRKFGLNPTPRGVYPGRDHMKAKAMNIPVNLAKKAVAIKEKLKTA
jgi:nitrate reductase cytochrome c-type subunit